MYLWNICFVLVYIVIFRIYLEECIVVYELKIYFIINRGRSSSFDLFVYGFKGNSDSLI